MKTKVVYCLVSNNQDYYYEHLLISLCSLRKHNPQIEVEIVCDYDTLDTLKDTRSGLYSYNVIVNPVETPLEWSNKERSRYIKTNLRQLTHGDYLYIDIDTIICSSLDGLDKINYEVAAVQDSHVERPLPKRTQCQHPTEFWIWGQAYMANVDIEGYLHFNSGVMYAKDTERAKELYTRWAEKYTMLLKSGSNVDQLPLLLVNREMGNIISPLEVSMNCQVSFEEGRKMLPNAKIIHFFPGQQKTILSSSWILDPIKETGTINTTIQKIIDHPLSFFNRESKVVFGDAVYLFNTPCFLEAYSSCPRFSKLVVSILIAYFKTKKRIYQIIH